MVPLVGNETRLMGRFCETTPRACYVTHCFDSKSRVKIMADKEKADESASRNLKRHQKFLPHWTGDFPWVRYDKDKHAMFCKVCCEAESLGHKVKNNFANKGGAGGNTNFQVNALRRHQDGDSTKTGGPGRPPLPTEHRRLANVLLMYKQKNDTPVTPIEAAFNRQKQAETVKDKEAVETLFHTAYHLIIGEQPLSRYASEIR